MNVVLLSTGLDQGRTCHGEEQVSSPPVEPILHHDHFSECTGYSFAQIKLILDRYHSLK